MSTANLATVTTTTSLTNQVVSFNSTTNTTSTSNVTTNTSVTLPVTMPAIQQTSLLSNGFHPTLLLIAPFALQGTPNASSATSLFIDLPLARYQPSNGTTGAVHFFLWKGSPPNGSATTGVRAAVETWIDNTTNPWATQAPSSLNITVYRFAHNLTNTTLLGGGTAYTLGVFIEQSNYVPGVLDWPLSTATPSAGPFSFIDVYGSWNAQGRNYMSLTAAPNGSPSYTTPIGSTWTTLPLTVWALCNANTGLSTPLPVVQLGDTPLPPPPPPSSVSSPSWPATPSSPLGFPASSSHGPALNPSFPPPSFAPSPPSILLSTPVIIQVVSPTAVLGASTPVNGSAPILSSPTAAEQMDWLVFLIVGACAVGTLIIVVLIIIIMRRWKVDQDQRELSKYVATVAEDDGDVDDNTMVALQVRDAAEDADDEDDEANLPEIPPGPPEEPLLTAGHEIETVLAGEPPSPIPGTKPARNGHDTPPDLMETVHV
jgi:hypothetical protein